MTNAEHVERNLKLLEINMLGRVGPGAVLDLVKDTMARFEDFKVDERNVGASIAAAKLLEIARTGEHEGVFGDAGIEAAAREIMGLWGIVRANGYAPVASLQGSKGEETT
jgi:hypothetical protein